MNNEKIYNDIFIEIFEVEEDELNEKFTFADVDKWDSLTHLSLISLLEEKFEVMFETEDILNYGSYLNGKEILKKYGVEF